MRWNELSLILFFLHFHCACAAFINFPSLGSWASAPHIDKRDDNAFDKNPNGSFFVWLPQDEYSGDTFFECVYLVSFEYGLANSCCSRFNFFADIDPTQYVIILSSWSMAHDFPPLFHSGTVKY